MAVVGTQTITQERRGSPTTPRVKIVTAGHVADGNSGAVVDMHKYITPSKIGAISRRTAGSTDVVAVKIEASPDSTEWETLITVLGSDALTAFLYATAYPTKPYRYFRVNVTTVGVGNTLTTTWYLQE